MQSYNNVDRIRNKLAQGQLCIGSCITFSDPSVSELFGYDFAWIDMEHAPITLESALAHILALRGTETAAYVRVPWNDPVLIKPVLELEPAAIIIPLTRTKDDVERAVSACKYPPNGIRGCGPRRGVRYGAQAVQDYIREADQRTLVIVQIEHVEAVANLTEILSVPGLDSVCIGPFDLSGSAGLLGQVHSPEVMQTVEEIITTTRKTDVSVGIATGFDAAVITRWIKKGIQWVSLNVDFVNLYTASKRVLDQARAISQGAS